MVPEESSVKYTILLAGILGMLGLLSASCVVGVGVGGGDCVNVSCGSALTEGLSVQGSALCDGQSDAEYTDLLDCGCSGPCADVCQDNLCTDSGETSDCGDCLATNCSPEHTTCAND
jgi:hypothetical protein